MADESRYHLGLRVFALTIPAVSSPSIYAFRGDTDRLSTGVSLKAH
jgi:hypothetical protein